MKKFKFKSLTMRIWFILIAVIFSIVLCISLINFAILDNLSETKERELLASAHHYVLDAVRNNTNNKRINNLRVIKEIQHVISEKNGAKVYFIDDHEKKVIDKSLLLWMSSFIKDETDKDYHQYFKETFNKQTYIFEISDVNENAYLISYSHRSQNEEVLKIILLSFIVILIGLPIAKLIANSIAKPLKELETYTKQIANKEWNSQLEIKSQDEIGRLAQAMDEMKSTLQQADEEEKKFLQSISHDLKTPVMVIMSYAQAIIDGIYVDSAENTAMIIKNEAVLLEKKIKQILYLNTLDYVLEHDQEQEEVNLDKLLTYLVRNFQHVNLDLSWHLNIETKPAIVIGNPDSIRVSIENVLENQLRFAAESIKVCLRENGPFWTIEISNDGPPIPEKDLEQIFENLYKGDNGKFGLGLAISKKIIHYYHGKVHVENINGRVCFAISYPKSSGA